MKLTIKQHHLLDIPDFCGGFRPLPDVMHCGELSCVSSFSGKSDAVQLIDQAYIDDLQDFIETDWLYDYPLSGNDLHQPLQHKSIQRLVHGRTSDTKHPGNQCFVQNLARLK